MKRNHDIIDIAGEVRRETEKAYLLIEGSKDVWLPKSNCE